MMYFDESQTPEKTNEKKKKKKVRSAWTSFVGRILGQTVGGFMSITLGLFAVQKHQASHEAAPQAALVQPPPPVVRDAASRTGGETVVAVLPLANFSSDAGDQYLADGMTEALVSGLAQVRGLRVISRTSTTRYKAGEKSVPEIAQELGADLVVEGSVVKAGDRVRVTAQLIDGATDEHVWARRYDQSATDVLGLQEKIATAIAADVRDTIAPPRPL